jgi:ATP-dependent Clp protease ATP-binding subunit ClpC
MFERFTNRARLTIVQAQEESRALHHAFIGPEHLLLALSHQSQSLAYRVLSDLGITETRVGNQLALIAEPGQASPRGHIPFTPEAKKTLELSLREALQLGDSHIGTEHILLGLLRQDEGPAADALRELGLDLNTARTQVLRRQPGPAGGPRAAVATGEPDVALGEPVWTESGPAEVESLRRENVRLRALLRRHDIDPDEGTGPGEGSGPGEDPGPGGAGSSPA